MKCDADTKFSAQLFELHFQCSSNELIVQVEDAAASSPRCGARAAVELNARLARWGWIWRGEAGFTLFSLEGVNCKKVNPNFCPRWRKAAPWSEFVPRL